MATKKQIKNIVELINDKYQFLGDSDCKNKPVTEYELVAEKSLNGWQLALAQKITGGWGVVLTQHRQVTSDTALLILQMLFHDILERQNLKHYHVVRRV